MTLAAPEQLLSLLVRTPAGVDPQVIHASSREQCRAARQTLALRGHRIETEGAAWRLLCAERHFSPARFLELRQAKLGEPLEVWESTSSTNDLAKRGAQLGLPEGALWVTEAQTAGRGRQGRSWSCAAHSGLLFSLLLRPDLSPERQPLLLPLVLGLGLCEGIRQVAAVDVRLKWPNDLLLEERKLAGVLVEVGTQPSAFLVAGIGINVDPQPEEFERCGLTTATSLAASMQGNVPRERLLAAVLLAIERRLHDWRAGAWQQILDAWRERDVLLGREVRLQTGHGWYDGHVIGIADSGFLRLRMQDGAVHEFSAGDVHLS